MPFRIHPLQVIHNLAPQRCRTTIYQPHAAQVVLATHILVAHHLDENGRHDAQLLDAEALHGVEVRGELEAREHHEAVAAVGRRQGQQGEAVDVAEGQDAEDDLRVDAEGAARDGLEGAELQDVGYDVVVGDHDGFLL